MPIKKSQKTYTLLGSSLIFVGIFLALFVVSSLVFLREGEAPIKLEESPLCSRYISLDSVVLGDDEFNNPGNDLTDKTKSGVLETDTSRKVIQVEKEITDEEKILLEETYFVQFTQDTTRNGIYVINLTDQSDIDGLIASLNATVETDIPVKMVADTIDWGIIRIGADHVWTQGSGSGVKIAIIDTGVQKDHPDLINNLVTGYDFVNNDDDANDDNGHGTHVAGIAAASSNQAGTVGVSHTSKILPIKVLNSQGYGYLSDVTKGIYYAVEKGARVINLSLTTTTESILLKNAVNYAANKGVLVVAAAGNDNGAPCAYPAAYGNAICVVATDSKNMLASFSNVGGELAAPGVSNYSTYIGSSYRYFSGTSMASPHVAGSAALLMSVCTKCSAYEVRIILRETAVDLGSLGKDILFGYGLVDLTSAVASLNPVPVEEPVDEGNKTEEAGNTDGTGNPDDTGTGDQEQNQVENEPVQEPNRISQSIEITSPIPNQETKYVATQAGDITVEYTLNPIVNETQLEKITLYLNNEELESTVTQTGSFILPQALLDGSQHWVKLVAYFTDNTQGTAQLIIDMTYIETPQGGLSNTSGNSVLGISTQRITILDIFKALFLP